MSDFQPEELSRYSRHILLEELGLSGQRKLKRSRILIIGLGGLGNPAATYLAAAGVGKLGLMDHDKVALTNLHRQVLFQHRDIGQPKVHVARRQLSQINPHIYIQVFEKKFCPDVDRELLDSFDIVLDCTDNFGARYAINSACHEKAMPLVHAAIHKFEGQLMVLNRQGGPCYSCIFPSPPPAGMVPSCDAAGVLGVLPGILGMIQAQETIKLIVGLGHPLESEMLLYDALACRMQRYKVSRDPECPTCAGNYDQKSISKADQLRQPVESAQDLPPPNALHSVPYENARRLKGACWVDIRSQGEREIVKFPDSHHVPLSQLRIWLKSVEPPWVVLYCKSGVRSLSAARMLHEEGFENIVSLQGGILGWMHSQKETQPIY